jgi:hypothetical protein
VNVPQSGIYFQVGAITQLVVEIIDITTGEPVPLQVAGDLEISILYPDGVTYQRFNAELYTDGSDGRIVYTTQNDGGSNVDLSEAGLYSIQGYATIGGVPLPPSERSDFYVLPNNTGVEPVISGTTGLVFYDTDNVRWAMTVDTNGDLQIAAKKTGPYGFVYLDPLVLQDSDGVYWTVTINTDGEYQTEINGTFQESVQQIVLKDTNGRSWVLTISTEGVLQTS